LRKARTHIESLAGAIHEVLYDGVHHMR
jgi:hypothetical protein